ncbi:MAG: hypothetical protein ACTSP5_11705 [Candidatus Heimdallarchaeota archaeon]
MPQTFTRIINQTRFGCSGYNPTDPSRSYSYAVKMIGEVDFRLTEGSNPEIQLSALLAHLVGLQLD